MAALGAVLAVRCKAARDVAARDEEVEHVVAVVALDDAVEAVAHGLLARPELKVERRAPVDGFRKGISAGSEERGAAVTVTVQCSHEERRASL